MICKDFFSNSSTQLATELLIDAAPKLPPRTRTVILFSSSPKNFFASAFSEVLAIEPII